MYRIEKETNGEKAIIIDGWQKGVSPDPYSGLGKVLTANLDVPGEIATGYSLTQNTLGAGTLNAPIHRAMNQTNGVATAYFILDSASQVWKSTTYNGTFSFLSTSNSTTGATATNQGLAYWQGYLFKFRNGSIDYLAGGSGTWVPGWNPVTGTTTTNNVIVPSVNHFALVSANGVLYFCNGAGVGSLSLNPNQTFDPTIPATYTFIASPSNTGAIALTFTGAVSAGATSATLTSVWTYQTGAYTVTFSDGEQKSVTLTNGATTATWTGGLANNVTSGASVFIAINALSIPFFDTAQSLAEASGTLLIGGSFNDIYPWDRLSPFFSFPIYLGDTFIDRMVTVNTNVYIFPGGATSRGRIYVSNGTNANLFFKIPDYITGQQEPYFTWGDAIFHRNNLIFGFFMKKNGGGFITADSSFGSTSQVWGIDLESKAFRSLSTMDASSSIGRASVLMPALQTSPGMGYVVGVEDSQGATPAAIEYSGTASGIGRYTVYTDLMPVGTLFDKRTFTQVEFKLRTALESGESLAILPIVDNVVGNQFLANTVGEISKVFPVNFQGAQWLSFLIQGIGNSASSGVKLHEIRVR